MQKCQRLWGCPVRRRFQSLVLLQVWPWECTIYGLISIPAHGLGEIMNDPKGKKRQTMQILSHDPIRGKALDLGGARSGQDTDFSCPPLALESPRPMTCPQKLRFQWKRKKKQAISFEVRQTVPQRLSGACRSDIKSRLRDQDGFQEEGA